MAANIEFNSQKNSYSFYSLKEVPWHSLGTVVEEAKTPEEIIHIANMDYQVDLAPMFASFIPDGAKHVLQENDHFACHMSDGNVIMIPKKGTRVDSVFATYRTNNYNILGTVGSRYEPVQNTEAMEFIYQVCKSQMVINPNDVIIQTAGVLGIGERIFVTAKLPTYEIAKDEMEKYILFTTSHDGSGSIQACFTDIRVVCNNTLNAALHHCKNMVRFKHTKNVKSNLVYGAQMMRESLKYSEEAKMILEAAENFKCNDDVIMDYITDLVCDANQKALIAKVGGIKNVPFDSEVISTRKHNQIDAMRNYVEKGPGQETHRGTMLWLYNGITSYINNGITYKDELNKFDSITQGNSFKLGQTAFNKLVQRISA